MNEQCKAMTPEEAQQYAEEDRKRMSLISAAPEMLEALEDIVDQWVRTRQQVPPDLSDSIRVFAQKAIQKARGGQ